MSRGIEKRTIFLDDTFRLHFLDLLGEMTDRFGVEVHAYVLMDNHYHLVMRTPGANASQAMQDYRDVTPKAYQIIRNTTATPLTP